MPEPVDLDDRRGRRDAESLGLVERDRPYLMERHVRGGGKPRARYQSDLG